MIWLIVKGRGRDEHHWVAALGRVYTPKEPVVGLGGRTLVHSIALPKSCKDTGQESSEWKATEGHALLYASKESNRMVWVRRKKCVHWELVGAVKVHVSSEAPLAEQVSATTITSCRGQANLQNGGCEQQKEKAHSGHVQEKEEKASRGARQSAEASSCAYSFFTLPWCTREPRAKKKNVRMVSAGRLLLLTDKTKSNLGSLSD